MQNEHFQQLIENYRAGSCTPAELKELQNLLENDDYRQMLEEIMDQQLKRSSINAQEFPEINARIAARVLDTIRSGHEKETHANGSGRSFLLRNIWWARAAAIAAIFLLSWGIYQVLILPSEKQIARENSEKVPAEILPGKDGAILTFEDGSQMLLDSLGNETITTKTGKIITLKDGMLRYENDEMPVNDTQFNTVSTPRGRQFRLQLSDGTKVWLNAASSIRYPLVFNREERTVEITGEAYFEVAKDAGRKFLVNVNNRLNVEVLGTHFNINSYADEAAIKTTLLEGSVRVFTGSQQSIIRPGQQASLNNRTDSKLMIENNVNVEKVVAWKNGQFDFNNASLHEVMRQLERWYDISVEYAPGVGEYEFVGKMDRGLTLQDVIDGLEMSEVRLEIVDGKTIIVKP